MSLRKDLENWQVRWAERNGISIGAPPGNPASRATGYVSKLQDNLFDPLSERAKKQFIAGAGGELASDGQSGNMYAVYSSSALCVNLFHYWFGLLDAAPPNSKLSLNPLLAACGLPARPVRSIDFEVPNIVNPKFKVPPHLDVQISFDDGPWKCAGIETKFCEPYGGQKPGGLKPVYLQQTALWRDWPNVRAFAQEISPNDLTNSYFHAAQLIKHLLGLRMQNGTNFVLVYLWFDIPGAEAAMHHRREIESFGEILKRDGVAFVSRTYQEAFEVLRGANGDPKSPHVVYLLERYLDDAPRGLKAARTKADKIKRAKVPPVGVFRSAEAFLIAADRHFQWLKENETVYALFDKMPIYFLYGQAIELMLKAYLRAQGLRPEDVEKYQHDLFTLYNKCQGYGLPLDQHSSNLTGILTSQFCAAIWHNQFRYISDFNEPFPSFEVMSTLSRALLEAVRPVCGGDQNGLEKLESTLLALQRGELPKGTTFSS